MWCPVYSLTIPWEVSSPFCHPFWTTHCCFWHMQCSDQNSWCIHHELQSTEDRTPPWGKDNSAIFLVYQLQFCHLLYLFVLNWNKKLPLIVHFAVIFFHSSTCVYEPVHIIYTTCKSLSLHFSVKVIRETVHLFACKTNSCGALFSFIDVVPSTSRSHLNWRLCN